MNLIKLNDSGSAYITIDYLPEELMKINENTFDIMWNLHPTEKHKVINTGKEIDAYRYSQSYLNTPIIIPSVISGEDSYMYSGFDTTNNNLELPEVFQPYYNYMKNIDVKYNQVVANWYEDGKDYIAFHSDNQYNMISNPKVSIISFYSNDECNPDNFRNFCIKPKPSIESIENIYKIRMDHGTIITMHGNALDEYKHGIKKDNDNKSKRISLSFRQMKE